MEPILEENIINEEDPDAIFDPHKHRNVQKPTK